MTVNTTWYTEYAAEKAVKDLEAARKAAQRRRDDALTNMTHTWADGSVVQVRPTDMPQFQSAIEMGVDQRWVLLDNTTRLTTVAEMQEALNSGLSQGKAIWDQYADELEALYAD